MEKPDFTESEYRKILEEERHMFAWTLRVYGGCSADSALQQAKEFYAYEEPSDLRGLVFHDEAWHWAMKRLFGDYYWQDHPEFASPSLVYINESDRLGSKSEI